MNLTFLKLSTALLVVSSAVSAQDPVVTTSANSTSFQEGFRPNTVIQTYDKKNVALPWETVREIDVMWKKTVWREIDTRDKMNETFIYSNDMQGDGMLIEILLNSMRDGSIQAFSNTDDRFSKKMTPTEIEDLTRGKLDTAEIWDPETGMMRLSVTNRIFDPTSIKKYRIKEETFFDRVRGKVFTRIIAIAPVHDVTTSSGVYVGEEAWFWIYYPELRNTLANHYVYNPENDISSLTWDDLFEKRMFASNIIRISNSYQGDIKQYKGDGLEAYYEAENIKEELFNREQDLWVN